MMVRRSMSCSRRLRGGAPNRTADSTASDQIIRSASTTRFAILQYDGLGARFSSEANVKHFSGNAPFVILNLGVPPKLGQLHSARRVVQRTGFALDLGHGVDHCRTDTAFGDALVEHGATDGADGSEGYPKEGEGVRVKNGC